MPKYCGECGYEPPCIYGKCINVTVVPSFNSRPVGGRAVIVCSECDHEVPCYHMDKNGRSRLPDPPKQEVLRCPNANDSCTFPDCDHIFPQTQEPTMNVDFNRKTKGNALAALRDMISQLTYAEMTDFARGIQADAAKINMWTQSAQNPDYPPTPTLVTQLQPGNTAVPTTPEV